PEQGKSSGSRFDTALDVPFAIELPQALVDRRSTLSRTRGDAPVGFATDALVDGLGGVSRHATGGTGDDTHAAPRRGTRVVDVLRTSRQRRFAGEVPRRSAGAADDLAHRLGDDLRAIDMNVMPALEHAH